MITFGAIVLVGMFIGFLVWRAVHEQKKSGENLAAVAQRLSLEFKIERHPFGLQSHTIEGTWQGRGVRFWSYTTGSGKSQRNWIAVGVQPARCGAFSFRIEPQGLGTRVTELFGVKEIQVGDPRFDAAWFVRTSARDLFGAALVPEIREKLMTAQAAGARGSYRLEDGWVMYAEQGSFAQQAAVIRLEGLLPLLHELAVVVEFCAREP